MQRAKDGNREVEIREATPLDCLEIARLHKKVLGGMGANFLPKLGESALSDIYAHLIEKEPGGFYVAESDGTIVGFVVGVSDVDKIRLFGFKFVIKAILGIYDLEMTRFQLIKKGLKHALYLFQRKNTEVKAELLDIVVHFNYQGMGIGKKLSDAFINHLISLGIARVQVLVDERWNRALEFYRRMNFEPCRLLSTPTGKMWVMIKGLSKNRGNQAHVS